jgi:hypothetical protein
MTCFRTVTTEQPLRCDTNCFASAKGDSHKILHMKPCPDFEDRVQKVATEYLAGQDIPAAMAPLVDQWKQHINTQAADKLTHRRGWFTRAHPYILDDGTILVGLYSDGFSFSLVALTSDNGETWRFSDPIVGGGNIQPSFAQRKNGNLVTYMRDNGPPPKRVLVLESADKGMTWSTVSDHPQLKYPGAGLEVANLADGDWVCIYNDTEQGRHSLAVSISTDEGVTWDQTRHLELEEPGQGAFSLPIDHSGRRRKSTHQLQHLCANT